MEGLFCAFSLIIKFIYLKKVTVTVNKKGFEESISWYIENRPLYEILAKKVEGILKEILDTKNIEYLKVECRTKSLKSFQKKIEKGISYEPTEMQDLAGIRIIGYVNSDVDKIVNVINDLFEIHEKRSADKSKMLGTNKVGYRSVHFVAKLSKERLELPEFNKFKTLDFEIQVRTILQHAWAEIQHDKNYKYSGVLPKEIERRFSLLAGLLELADNEFESISNLIENHSKEISKIIESGKFDIPIDSTSLRTFMSEIISGIQNIDYSFGDDDDNSIELIEELNDMGIHNLQELNDIIPSNYFKILDKYEIKTNFSSIIRDLLIIEYNEKYFTTAWKNHWGITDTKSFEFYGELGINIDEFRDTLTKYGIYIVDYSLDDIEDLDLQDFDETDIF